MKICSKCGIEKEIELFNKDKYSSDGHRCNCKDCSKKYREDNKDKSREYRILNKEKYKEYFKKRKKDPEKSKQYYLSNKESIKEKAKIYYEKNKESKIEYQKEYQSKNKKNRNVYLSERRRTDHHFRFITNIRNLINNSFYQMGYSKKSKTCEILGCEFDEFEKYLESKFESWMTWDNKGLYNGELNHGWDIDHIIPISSAETEDDLVKLNHYTNLRPLCSKTNRDIKKNNINYAII